MFFATVIEIDGIFLGFAGCAWWLTARCVARPSWQRASAVGAATAVAAMVHGTGHLLPGVAVAFCCTWPAERAVDARGLRLLAALVVLASHTAVFSALSAVFLGDAGRMGGAAAYVLRFDLARLEYLPRSAAREWLLPYFPVSVIALGGLFRPSSRPPSLAFCGLALVYIAVSFVLIPGAWERGTYCLPLVFFGASLAGLLLAPRGLAAAGALAAATAAALVLDHDRPDPDLLPAEAILTLAREQKTLFVVEDVRESDAVLRADPEIPVARAIQLVMLNKPSAELTPLFDHLFVALRNDHTRMCISQRALDLLAQERPELHRHLVATYELQRVESGSFVAYMLSR